MRETSFDLYQVLAGETAVYPDKGTGSAFALAYVALGLTGEAGEVAEKVKKLLRDSDGVVTDAIRATLRDELGDVLWYAARLAAELSLPFGDVADRNIQKLHDRQQRGVLKGSGDAR